MEKKVLQEVKGTPMKAPYSAAVLHRHLIFISGQVAYDYEKKTLVSGTIEEEAGLALENLRTVVEEVGSGFDRVLKVMVYLTDIDEYERFNDVYKEFFPKNPPARSCVAVSALPYGAKVEIDAIAHI
jgi:2-iminobutanoate/2-iminopropanoate deaminase